MKSFSRIAISFFILVMAVGCASTDVTKQSRMHAGYLTQPDRIYVFPFVTNPADIPSWSTAAKRYAQSSSPQTQEEIDAGRELGTIIAKELVAEIKEMGLFAMEGNQQTAPRVNDILLVGYFETIEEGSTIKRMAIGFGSGATETKTVVEGYQMTDAGLRQLGSAEIESDGSKTPGLFVPIAVLAATANPIGLIVMGSAKLAGEVTGRSKVEGAAKRTAEAIAKQLKIRFEERGWIR
jgi:uncharacterized protein DUF4410